MRNIALSLVLTTALGAVTGCDPAEAEPQAVAFRPGDGSNTGGGVFLNTNAIGTHAFSELDLSGAVHEGVRLDAVRIKPQSAWLTLDSVSSDDGELVGVIGGTTYRGAAFTDSQWDLTFVAGQAETPATMWIDAYSSAHGHKYTFKYKDAQNVEQHVCDVDPDGGYGAIALADISVHAISGEVTSRDDTLYLGCTSGAVGKAAAWGYPVWDLGTDEFEAAIRVVRADYCGNGASWTVPGTYLQLTDTWATNSFHDAQASTEAIWGAAGALCIGAPRLEQYAGAVTCNGTPVPACAPSVTLAGTSGGLFWTKNVD